MAKVTLVGGGSPLWTPGLLRDIMVNPTLGDTEVVLHDVDRDALDLQLAVAAALRARTASPVTVTGTTQLDRALDGADHVVVSISTGGLEAMRHDLEIPAAFGIHQSVGDTVGPGGLARALRAVPVMTDLARAVERLAPRARIINLTNPMTVLCRAMSQATSVPVVGLCHEVSNVRAHLALVLDVPETSLRLDVAGVNHLPWVVRLDADGEDGLARLARLAADGPPPPPAGHPGRSTIDRWQVKLALLRLTGCLPAAGDRHVAEFFPFFLSATADRGRAWGVELTTVSERRRRRATDIARCRSLVNRPEIADLTPSREQLAPLLAALAGGPPARLVVNLPNRGQLPQLPPDVVVESYVQVDAGGLHPETGVVMPPVVAGWVRRHVENQELTVAAARHGDRRAALQVLLCDPLLSDLRVAEPLLGALLAAHRQYLPQFAGEWSA